MDFVFDEELRAKRQEWDNFFREEMKDAPEIYHTNPAEAMFANDESWAFHKQLQKKILDRGWYTLAWEKKYGGQEASIMEQFLFNEVRGFHHAPGIDGSGVGMFAPTLMLFATEDQKQRLLVPIGKGEVHYCQGWSEPDSGSDLASLKTKAIKDGDYYILNGQKIWTSGAHRADRMFILARTDPTSKRNKGLSVFSLDMNLPGIEVRPIRYMNGRHIYNEVFFTDVKVPACDMIGLEGEGWKVTRETMNFERSGAPMFSEQKRMFMNFIEYLKTTKRRGKYLWEDPVVKQKLGTMYADMQRGYHTALRVAWTQHKDGLRMPPHIASEAKLFGSEISKKLDDLGTEILGPYGQVENSKWAPVHGLLIDDYQFIIGACIAMGSTEIQLNLIAWTGLGLPRS